MNATAAGALKSVSENIYVFEVLSSYSFSHVLSCYVILFLQAGDLLTPETLHHSSARENMLCPRKTHRLSFLDVQKVAWGKAAKQIFVS